MFLRSITIVLLVACINAPLLAADEYTQAKINEEIAKAKINGEIAEYSEMERTGKVVRNVGFGFMGAGAVTIGIGAIAMSEIEHEGGGFVFLGCALFGSVGLIAGGICAITGGVIRHESHKKRIDLEKRLSIRYTGNGMAVVFTF